MGDEPRRDQGRMEHPSPKRVVILGGGLLGATAEDIGGVLGYETVGFLDNRKPAGQTVSGRPILGPFTLVEKDASLRGTCGFIVAVSDAPLRREWIARIRAAGGRLVNLIHPAVHCAGSARLGEGLLIHAFTTIYPGAVVGDGCLFENQVTITPEAVVDPVCVLAVGVTLCHRSRVGSGTLVGVGSVVCPGVTVGEECLIGANSTVTRDIPARKVAIGSPARVRRDNIHSPADAERR